MKILLLFLNIIQPKTLIWISWNIQPPLPQVEIYLAAMIASQIQLPCLEIFRLEITTTKQLM